MILAQLAVTTMLAVPNPACSIGTSFGRPTVEHTVLIASATGETEVIDVVATFPLAQPISQTVAHRFRVERTLPSDAPLAPGQTFLVIPWGYDGGCRREVFEEPWMPAGERGVFVLGPHRVHDSGERVVDLLGWHAPYPQGAFLRYMQPVPVPRERGEWLSVDELFDLVSALPPYPIGVAGADHHQHVIDAIVAGPVEWSARFPGTAILALARIVAGLR